MPVSFEKTSDKTASMATVTSVDRDVVSIDDGVDVLKSKDVVLNVSDMSIDDGADVLEKKVPFRTMQSVTLLGGDMANPCTMRSIKSLKGEQSTTGDGSRSAKVIGHRAHLENCRKGRQMGLERRGTMAGMGGLDRRGSLAHLRQGTKKLEEEKVKKQSILDKFMKRSNRHCLKKGKQTIIVVVLVLQLIGAIISLVLLWPNKPESGDWADFGPRKTMIVEDSYNAVFLAISRITAYMMYPCIILVFVSKAHCLRTWLWTTMARLYLPYFERLHAVHECTGWFCFGLTWLHAVFHVIRWARLEHLDMLFNTQTGRTGFIGWVCITVVVLPMGVFKLRRTIRYEIRKALHVLCGVGFGVSGALHAPATKVLYVYGTVLSIYIVDWFFANVYKTYEVETCHFTRLQNAVVLHWKNPHGYNKEQHGYVNICIPFIKRYQWHAISIYPHMEMHDWSSLCIAKAGDWSNQLHADTVWKTTRPIWIQGPFLTPFSATVDYDNIIVVSSGSGISASLACLSSLKKTRRVSLIWLCRDASMVQYYMETYNFDTDAYTLIFYTGKQKLCVSKKLPPMVLIFESRPDLRSVICKIIKSIEAEDGLPEDLLKESEELEETIAHNASKLENIATTQEPLKILKKLIRRALNHYTEDEIMGMLNGEEDNLTAGELEHLISSIAPDAVLSAEVLEAFAVEFDDGTGNGTVSREKFCDHCTGALNEMHGFESEASPTAARNDSDRALAEAKGRALLDGGEGSEALKEYIADLDEEAADGHLKRWAVMYCGGSKVVTEALSKVCSDFDIKYDQERFDW